MTNSRFSLGSLLAVAVLGSACDEGLAESAASDVRAAELARAVERGECADTDRDGFVDCIDDTLSEDCDDTNREVSPAAEEWCNALDDDCDGEVNEGWPGCEVSPGPDEGPRAPAPDCVDQDGDGSWACTRTVLEDADCDDTNREVSPAAEEWCNALDDDCDGEVNEGWPGCDR